MLDVQAPPAVYDHQFHGTVQIHQHRMGEVERYCGLFTPVLGCTPIGGLGGVCHINIVTPGLDGISKSFYLRVLRHEMAHCNGWPAGHP